MSVSPSKSLRVAAAVLPLLAVAAHAQVRWTHLSSSRGDLPAPTGAREQTACVTGDFNGDLRADIVVASRLAGGKIEVWLSTPNGRYDRRLVEASDVLPEAGGAVHDIDGDGDLDLVFGQDSRGRDLYWWENPKPNFQAPWTRRLIRKNSGTKHHDQAFGDVDGDGVSELVTWNQGSRQLVVFEIPANPRATSPWSGTAIYTAASQRYEGLALADVDLDGTVDIVAAGRWWKHRGGTRYQDNVIDASQTFTRVAVGQLVRGGRPEIVFTPGESIGNAYWYSWNGTAWQRNTLLVLRHGHTLDIADIDRDGNADIFVGEMRLVARDCKLCVLYGDGRGTFAKQTLSVGNGIHEGRLADLDGDGDLDIVHKPYNDGTPRLDAWRNESASLRVDRWRRQLVQSLSAQAMFVRGGDLDGDGYSDMVAGDSWYRNPRAKNVPWQRNVIGNPFRNLALVHDLDGDGDLDLLGTQGVGAQPNARFAWAENDGRGRFVVRTNIANGVGDFLQGVAARRFGAANAALEIALSWHDAKGGVQMLTVPSNPRTQTWSWRKLNAVSLGEALSDGDVDGDGDADLMLGTVWLENPSWKAHTLGRVDDLRGYGGTPEPDRNKLVDVDRDGDLDVVVSLELGREILWFENPRPTGSVTGAWKRHVIGISEGQGFSMDAGDLDADGDIDVVVGEHRGGSVNRVLAFLNDGTTASWPVQVLDSQSRTVADHHDGTQLIDVDRDGDLDVLSLGWSRPKLWWFENLARDGVRRKVTDPSIVPPSSVFRSGRVITLHGESGAELRFTLDGSTPSASSPLYGFPIVLDRTATLKVRAFRNGSDPSDVVTSHYARITDELAYWRFDGVPGVAVLDDAAAARHGASSAARVPGRFQGALDFAGPVGFVLLPSFDVDGNAMSISAWLRADRFAHLPSHDSRILSKAVGLADQSHLWMLSTVRSAAGTVPRFRLKTGGVTKTLVASTGALPTGKWIHVAAVYDGAEMRLYVAGSLVGRRAASGKIDKSASAPVWIGDAPPTGGRPFDGRIDELRLFERALTEGEIAALSSAEPIARITSYGRSTRACAGEMRLEASRPPIAGDRFFTLSVAEAPPNAIGFLLLGAQPHTGLSLWGVDLFLSPIAGSTWFNPLLTSARGLAAVPLPLVAAPVGTRLFGQAIFVNNRTCGASRGVWSASDAIMFDVGR